MSDFESLVEGDKCTLGPPQQQRQQFTVPEECKTLAPFAQEALNNKTEHAPMSEMTVPFAETITQGHGYVHEMDPLGKVPGTKFDPPPFSWQIIDKDGTCCCSGSTGLGLQESDGSG